MEKIFENKCIYTYDYFLQLKRRTMSRSFVRTCYVFLAIAMAFSVITWLSGWYKFSLIAIALLAFVLYRLIGTPIRLARFSTKKNREIHGNDLETINLFFDDHLEATNMFTKGKTKITYTDIQCLFQTKSLYIIGMDGGLVLMLDKNGFTKGTREEFTDFIKEKCVNASNFI